MLGFQNLSDMVIASADEGGVIKINDMVLGPRMIYSTLAAGF